MGVGGGFPRVLPEVFNQAFPRVLLDVLDGVFSQGLA